MPQWDFLPMVWENLVERSVRARFGERMVEELTKEQEISLRKIRMSLSNSDWYSSKLTNGDCDALTSAGGGRLCQGTFIMHWSLTAERRHRGNDVRWRTSIRGFHDALREAGIS